MSYEKKSIATIMDEIDSRKIVLPSIQRKYVWDEEQIEKLMDSIMRGYPFGTFLFWIVKKKIVNKHEYPMYEFIKDYNEHSTFENPRAAQPFLITPENENDTLCAVLDGQQRLTSLYIALKGSLSKKIPKKRWDNPDAFPKKELYFNLLSQKNDEDDDILYEFKFLSKDAYANNKDVDKLWYKVKDILQFSDLSSAINPKWITNQTIINNITTLFSRIKIEELVNYFEKPSESIDDVLDIFVRVNSGGTVLSKTDLLFSTIIASWQDARDEIDDFLNTINGIGDHYEFNSDFIMRTCLYALDMPILMKVDSFKQDSIELIKTNWNNIKISIKDVVNLLSNLGFSSDNIVSNNAILPIIYYRFTHGEESFSDKDIKYDVRKYFVISQVKKIFSGHTNQTLDIFRNTLRGMSKLSFSAMEHIPLSYGNVLACNKSDIGGWLEEFKKGPYTFLLLSLLYPDLKYSDTKFEQDHLHPDSCFKTNILKNIVLSDGSKLSFDQIASWIDKSATLPNLQLLTPHENEARQNMPLVEWVKNPENKTPEFLPDTNLEFNNFEIFYKKRKKLITDKFADFLGIKDDVLDSK